MEHGVCNVIYTDRRANDEHVQRETLSDSLVARTSTGHVGQSYFALGKTPPAEVHGNVEAILSIFSEGASRLPPPPPPAYSPAYSPASPALLTHSTTTTVHICGSGRACLSKIASILDSPRANAPTFVIIDVPYDEEQRLKRLSREPRTPSPTSGRLMRPDTTEPNDTYGTHLLTHLASEISSKNFSKLVVPVVMLTGLDRDSTSQPLSSPSLHGAHVLMDTVRLSRYLDLGAFDVFSSPLSKERMHGLVMHAYRLQKEFAREEASFLTSKRNRKLSWVGVDDPKPYGYLREAMVSNLMTGICNPETVGESLNASDFHLSQDQRHVVEEALGTWAFSAHDYTDDELLYGALVMLKHALQMTELEKWRIPEASRTAYNEFVKYHNFRHVVDVLQALFHFLVRIGTLPQYPPNKVHDSTARKSPIAQLLKPFDALTLLISAIGHDVGHPGVNNAFLVALNAPLAQLYNDRSVLESFHCAAYSQILRRYWPQAFSDSAMRKLMINNILATDMGLHFKYMSDLGNLQEKIAHDKGETDGWNAKMKEEQKDLACGVLIKCADICNVARKFDTAAKWANILTDEFSNQGLMEQELEMPSCLFGGPPVRDDMIKLGESQIGFMNIFACPLFEAVTDILPAMRFAVDEILANKTVWEKKIEQERQKKRKHPNFSLGKLAPGFSLDPSPSPFSGGPTRSIAEISQLRAAQDGPIQASPEDSMRRGSSGTIQPTTAAEVQSSSTVGDKESKKRTSLAGFAGQRASASPENQGSRRGSGDASLTKILVTQTPNPPETFERNSSPTRDDHNRGQRKDTLTGSASSKKYERDSTRPVTAPSSARHSTATNLYPSPQPSSQSHSQVDLSHTVNGNFDGSKLQQWGSNKISGDSNMTRSDVSRNSSWWRQMSTRRNTRDTRNGDSDGKSQHKETTTLEMPPSNNTSTTASPTLSSPDRKTTSGKIKSFFKRKPRNDEQHPKQLSSFGSSSQLRSPPTSDPSRSWNSDD
ncbi:3',5'-cyclic-nucleotide phosphodiesterase [Pleosporales sp. CAS-2024a]